jgi:hypothetical protein
LPILFQRFLAAIDNLPDVCPAGGRHAFRKQRSNPQKRFGDFDSSFRPCGKNRYAGSGMHLCTAKNPLANALLARGSDGRATASIENLQ